MPEAGSHGKNEPSGGLMTTSERRDIRSELGLRPVVNAAGTMTTLGASSAIPEAIAAATEIMPEFVEIADLQRKASAVIASMTGAEAGVVTACSSAGITLAVAGCMTGADLAKVEQLPDATGMKHAVPIQIGHLVDYGAPVDQAIRLAGARLRPFGQATSARAHQLRAMLDDDTAAAVYVVSHHCVEYGQIPLAEFCSVCHEQNVPVIVDAAAEYDLRGFLEQGADLVVYSGHKFLGGPTSGIVAGRKDLVRAAYLQNVGIGRGMKVGKEGIVGVMAALEVWRVRDHAAVRGRQREALDLWRERLAGHAGIGLVITPDPTGNPVDRLRVVVDPDTAGAAAWDLASALAAGDPPVMVRVDQIDLGWFDLDPCNLHPGDAERVAERIAAELDRAAKGAVRRRDLAELHAAEVAGMLAWPD